MPDLYSKTRRKGPSKRCGRLGEPKYELAGSLPRRPNGRHFLFLFTEQREAMKAAALSPDLSGPFLANRALTAVNRRLCGAVDRARPARILYATGTYGMLQHTLVTCFPEALTAAVLIPYGNSVRFRWA
jgi:hypothetical protein